MPESESFDAFYARTVWNVTSQMHALAGEDSAADHAIREAYAQAYQQWYEVADYPDTEGWVLSIAREAYERRRPEAAARPVTQAATGHDSLSWPGLYRPRTPAATSDDPAATIGGPFVGMAAAPAVGTAGPPAGDLIGHPAAGGVGLVPGPPGGATAALAGADQGAPPTRTVPPGPPRPGRPSSRRSVVALTAAVAVIVAAGTVYLTTRGHPAGNSAQHHAAGNKGPVMLGAGQTGSRSAIPWQIVGRGWTLAEVSSAPATTAAGAVANGTTTTYLVDPAGGRYQVETSSPGVTPLLLAWTGDTQDALLAVPPSSPGGSASYELLSTRAGTITPLPLPANVTAVGFTRPDGENILAVRTTSDAFKLQRYNLQGEVQATIGSLPRKSGSPDWVPGCGIGCGALSSPDGLTDIWGVTGDEMQLVGNAGGGKVTRLTVPGGTSCVPLTWHSSTTVLAYCTVNGQPYPNGQLWLVPVDHSAPTPLTNPSGSQDFSGVATGAWQAPGAWFATETGASTCTGSGQRGLSVATVSGGSLQPVTVRGTSNNRNGIVSVYRGQLLLLGQTSCAGTSSLIWLNPSTGGTTTVLAGQSGQIGVLAAVPYGIGPTATSVG